MGRNRTWKCSNNTTRAKYCSNFKGGMYCKGYNPYGFNGVFDENTRQAVINLQTDANLPIRDGKVYAYIFKAFLTMDAYKRTTGGNERIREMQRDLNYHYYTTAGVQPCDGHFQRGTHKALIYGIQTEQGIPPAQQTGAVGPTTRILLPTLNVGSRGAFVKLFQYALYVNGYDPGAFDGIYGNGVRSKVIEFQDFCKLTPDGIAGRQTWLSALISTGDPDRRGTACDCITMITPTRAQTLRNAGYQTVRRYLVNVPGGLNKRIQPGELNTIFNAGLTVFPIFQKDGTEADDFNYNKGKRDAQDAYSAAKTYGFKRDTTIYFAVDFDALGNDITNNILPYFQGVNEQMAYLGNFYKIGVYGPRSVCIQVSNKGWASTSFVSGMSTGYSGNLGYPLPSNWAFDQISNITIGSGDGAINIDNNIKSGRDNGASSVDVPSNLNQPLYKQLSEFQILALEYAQGNLAQANYLTTNYYRRVHYESELWTLISGPIIKDFHNYVHNSVGENSFVWATDPSTKLSIDTPHMVATISALLYTYFPIGKATQQDLAGWGGDLLTLVKDVMKNRNSSRYSGNLHERTYQCAIDYIGTTTLEGEFDFADLTADADAINISKVLIENESKPILNAVQDYYEGNDVFSRYTRFLNNRFSGSESTLRNTAIEILNGNDVFLTPAREAFKDAFSVPDYSLEEGEIIGNAFADKILTLVQNEANAL